MSDHNLYDEFYEHFNYRGDEKPQRCQVSTTWLDIFFRGNKKEFCVAISPSESGASLCTSYYVGTDWLHTGADAIYVAPKLDKQNDPTDYLSMLFQAAANPDFAKHLDELCEIKLNAPFITVPQHADLLTPLLVVHYLHLLRSIVRKGLKKGYYRVENNLHSKVKGKVLVGANIKKNNSKGQYIKTICQYDEYGFDCIENRILKTALDLCSRYLSSSGGSLSRMDMARTWAYILPAFERIRPEPDAQNIRTYTLDGLYKDYNHALKIARLIIQRYGFNIQSINNGGYISVPPFWINMTKLFELFVLEQLRKKFGKGIAYQSGTAADKPDYLLRCDDLKMIIDAKYKPSYNSGVKTEDIRQLSGYSRAKGILELLGYKHEEMESVNVFCLIIYPDQVAGLTNLADVDYNPSAGSLQEIKDYVHFYQMAVQLPKIKT